MEARFAFVTTVSTSADAAMLLLQGTDMDRSRLSGICCGAAGSSGSSESIFSPPVLVMLFVAFSTTFFSVSSLHIETAEAGAKNYKATIT